MPDSKLTATHENKLILRGIFIYYLYLGVSLGSILLLTPIMLRYLGQSTYGIWVVFGSVVGYSALFDFGMNTAVAKYTAEYRAINMQDRLNRLVSTIFLLFIIIDVAIVLLSAVFVPFVPYLLNIPKESISSGQITFMIMVLNVAFMLLGGVFGNIIYGYQRVDVWKTFSIIQILVNSLLTIFFLRMGHGLIGVAVASISSTLVLIFLYILFLHLNRYGIIIDYRLVNKKIFKEISPYSLRTFILGLTNRLLYYTDYIVIAVFLGTAQVTPYEVAYKICFLVTYLFSVVSTTLFPKFSKLYALENIEGLRKLYLNTTKLSVAIITPLAIFLLFFGHSFINLWVGEENFVGMDILLLLILMDFIHAVGTPAGILLQGIGKNKEFVYSEVVNAGLNLLLSVILIQKIGVLGVALGTLIAHLCTSSWVVPLLACRFVKLPITRYLKTSILPPFLVGIATGITVHVFIKERFQDNIFNLGVAGALVMIIYLAIYLILGITKEERQMYRGLFQRTV